MVCFRLDYNKFRYICSSIIDISIRRLIVSTLSSHNIMNYDGKYSNETIISNVTRDCIKIIYKKKFKMTVKNTKHINTLINIIHLIHCNYKKVRTIVKF